MSISEYGYKMSDNITLPLGSTIVLCAVYHNSTWGLKILAYSIIQLNTSLPLLAQMVERRPDNQRVLGSSPIRIILFTFKFIGFCFEKLADINIFQIFKKINLSKLILFRQPKKNYCPRGIRTHDPLITNRTLCNLD